MGKHLELFQTQEDFNNGNAELTIPWVSYTVETNTVTYKSSAIADVAGIIVCSNGTTRKYLTASDYLSTGAPSGFTPIGVVVIPKSHTADGKGRMISLDFMSVADPDNGTSVYDFNTASASDLNIYWGDRNVDTDIPNLPLPCIGVSNDIANLPSQQTLVETVDFGLIAENISVVADGSETGMTTEMKCVYGKNPYDTETQWGYLTDGGTDNPNAPLIPSPYLSNGSINPIFRSEGTVGAALSGREYTDILLNLSTAQADWKTAETITNSYNSNYYPAACTTWRYSTVGTSQGDWYLPSIGELLYLPARAKQIQEALDAIGNVLKFNGEENMVGASFRDMSLLGAWSSSEFSGSDARALNSSLGGAGDVGKNGVSPVVAFAPAF